MFRKFVRGDCKELRKLGEVHAALKLGNAARAIFFYTTVLLLDTHCQSVKA